MNWKQSSDDALINPAMEPTDLGAQMDPNRREFLAGLGGAAAWTALAGSVGTRAFAQAPETAVNMARVAIPTSQFMMSENKISALNDGFTPENSFDRAHALYALWASRRSSGESPSWVQYEWSE